MSDRICFFSSPSRYVVKISRLFWKWLGAVSGHRAAMVLFIAVAAFAGCLIVGRVRGIPAPIAHDEFSQLLAADTFSSGRLANPAHPMWKSFESFHIIQKPVYMSKFPPAQGFFLAIGQVIFGHPAYGLWLSVALMCAAVCWMLQAWMPPRWALLGGLLTILHPGVGITSYWSQSYWGGTVAAFGGALVFGSLRRIARGPNVRDSLIMGLGIAVLFNSRVFEGVVSLVPVFTLLPFLFLGKKRHLFGRFARRVLLPVAVCGIITLAATGYYNKRVTGNIFVAPYNTYESNYLSAPLFIWQKLVPQPVFNNKEMLDYDNDFAIVNYRNYTQNGFLGMIRGMINRVYKTYLSYSVDYLFTVPLFLGLCLVALGSGWMVFVYSAIFTVFAAQFFVVPFFYHYSAPIAGLFIILLMQGFRMLFCLRIRRMPIGKPLTALYFIFIFVLNVYPLAKEIILPQPPAYAWGRERVRIIDALKKTGEKHLIIVRYSGIHSFHSEWVYNRADIDNAAVIWARELDNEQNRGLLEYFRGRKAWLLEVVDDGVKPGLKPYLPKG